MLVVKKLVFNMFAVNTYVIWDEGSSECMIVDPGCADPDEEKKLQNYIEVNNLKVRYLLNTHCHIDHILGCAFIKQVFGAEYFAPEKDRDLLEHAAEQAGAFGIEIKKPPAPDSFINENTVLVLGNSPVTFLYTPGHTSGEYCFYFGQESFCLTGDVLFKNSIGRTDLWGGDFAALIDSIKNKLFVLPDNVMIYPGHGESSKIGLEKNGNPFLKDLGNR